MIFRSASSKQRRAAVCENAHHMARFTVCLAIAFALLAADSIPAIANSKVDARYSISLTGIPIGKGALVIEINESGYTASGSATVTGLLELVSPAKGSAAARGKFVDGKVSPVTYSLSSESGKHWEDIRMSVTAGFVRDFSVFPPPSKSHERIAITEEHRKGVVDPMSAAIMSVPGNGDIAGADACNRTLSIFDGRQRYDLVFSHERTEPAKDVKGYTGPLAVCRVAYRPIAGHRPDRLQVKHMTENKNIFVWLAPIAGTRILVPVRVSVATMIGTLVVQATQFSNERYTPAPAGSATK